jgi:hypothetical protein
METSVAEQSSTCPYCQPRRLYACDKVSATAVEGIDLLPGLHGVVLGFLQKPSSFRVVICADCGLTRLFADEEARAKLLSASDWRPLK